MRKEDDLIKVKALRHGDSCAVNWMEEGGAEVYRLNSVFVVFEVPQYGGEPRFQCTFGEHEAEAVVDLAYSWT